MAPQKHAPNLAAYLKSLKDQPLETSIEYLISLLKRRQIKTSRPCAIATAQLLLRVVARFRWSNAEKLIDRIQEVGQRLIEAQPREMAVGNIVKRVLGMIRDEIKEDESEGMPQTPQRLTGLEEDEGRKHGYGMGPSMFNLLSAAPSPTASPSGANTPVRQRSDLKAEIISGIEEIIDEIMQVDEQIAAFAKEHIHSNEVILTQSSSRTVQNFLLKAAEKRKFTVIYAEGYPNDHVETHEMLMGKTPEDEMDTEAFEKSLTAAGITVILISDAAIFAIMSQVNKVILGTHAVIANGGLVAAAGARMIAQAAGKHRVPVIVLSGVYKLSPEYPFEFDSLIEYGDTGNIINYEDGDLVDKIDVDNPVFDYVPPELVDLYITNLGAHAPSYLYRIVADHYKSEDINFNKPEAQI